MIARIDFLHHGEDTVVVLADNGRWYCTKQPHIAEILQVHHDPAATAGDPVAGWYGHLAAADAAEWLNGSLELTHRKGLEGAVY